MRKYTLRDLKRLYEGGRANDFNFVFSFTVRHCSERGGVKAVRLDPLIRYDILGIHE